MFHTPLEATRRGRKNGLNFVTTRNIQHSWIPTFISSHASCRCEIGGCLVGEQITGKTWFSQTDLSSKLTWQIFFKVEILSFGVDMRENEQSKCKVKAVCALVDLHAFSLHNVHVIFGSSIITVQTQGPPEVGPQLAVTSDKGTNYFSVGKQ